MSLRADSYSSTGEVKAFTRHLLAGQSNFNSTTRPTLTDLEHFIDRVSGVLNVSLAQSGFLPTNFRVNSTAKLMGDDWVTTQAVKYTELTQRGTGYSEADGSRIGAFNGLYKAAADFIDANKLGLQRIGVPQTFKLSDGLQFTGLDAKSMRADPQDDTLAQPDFSRNQFDFPTINTDLERE